MYYYPYVNGTETLPIPYDHIQHEEDNTIPLSERNPGNESIRFN